MSRRKRKRVREPGPGSEVYVAGVGVIRMEGPGGDIKKVDDWDVYRENTANLRNEKRDDQTPSQ